MSLERISSFAPLPIRIIAGIAFIIYGLPKFSNIHGTQGLLGSFGLPPELALTIGILETIGGFALIFGILTRIDFHIVHNRNDVHNIYYETFPWIFWTQGAMNLTLL